MATLGSQRSKYPSDYAREEVEFKQEMIFEIGSVTILGNQFDQSNLNDSNESESFSPEIPVHLQLTFCLIPGRVINWFTQFISSQQGGVHALHDKCQRFEPRLCLLQALAMGEYASGSQGLGAVCIYGCEPRHMQVHQLVETKAA